MFGFRRRSENKLILILNTSMFHGFEKDESSCIPSDVLAQLTRCAIGNSTPVSHVVDDDPDCSPDELLINTAILSPVTFINMTKNMTDQDKEDFYDRVSLQTSNVLSFIKRLNISCRNLVGKNLPGIQTQEEIGWVFTDKIIPKVLENTCVVPEPDIKHIRDADMFTRSLMKNYKNKSPKINSVSFCPGLNFDNIKLIESLLECQLITKNSNP
ncbi:hypothetical protein [Salmon gill poxvirus]|uniref:Uncharacterized protein n=1 Tax=Salmon gill poxvirus TaxID=1680908 RepID=A0A0H4Y1A3_9POXV|nr:hypothetical protein AL387_gp063 [Salmon gill poxvirus]AKR04187.1 hypothetical protein SGPV063 [Salmon gill poxvirus]WMX26468.1 hypothetical protein [Salmon gill poxvirus]